MRFIMLSLIAAIDAAQLQEKPSAISNLKPTDAQGLVNPIPQLQADLTNRINSILGGIMTKVQPILNSNLVEEYKENPQLDVEASAAIKIDVSPTFDISVNSNMDGSFHHNNNAASVDSEVTRVNGGMAVADFAGALHDNNDAIGKGNVERLNGAAIGAHDESTSDMMNGAVNSIGALGGVLGVSNMSSNSALSLHKKPRTPLSLRQSSATLSRKSEKEGVRRDSANAFLSIQVNPAINIDVTANMTDAFYENNNAKSEKGNVQRVNGAMAVADFSGALYNNNNAVSTDGDVERVNGAIEYGR